VRLWFWGWLIAAAAIAIVSAAARDRASAPFALGALTAAALEAFGISPGAQWIAFAGVSMVVFAVTNRAWYRPKHGSRRLGRHGSPPSDGRS
jgi:membrane protein implicated in regulation of membrane protease activity